MKFRNKKCIMLYISIGIVILGVCLIPGLNKKETGSREKAGTVAVEMEADTEMDVGEEEKAEITYTEPAYIEPAGTYIPAAAENEGTGTEDTVDEKGTADTEEEDDTDYVLYLADEEVRDNPVFDAFINRKTTAYDREEEKSRYIYEYFADCWNVYGVHYMAEDLDGDSEDELLAFVQASESDGDLYVFHEEDGKLYAWETWKDFMFMRMMEVRYCGNGIFFQGGSSGESIARYNEEGKLEYIMKYRHWGEREWGTGKRQEYHVLTLYKDGVEEKVLEYEEFWYTSDKDWEIAPEYEALKEECERLIDKTNAECGVLVEQLNESSGKNRDIYSVDYEVEAEKIPLEELLGGQ